jgi:hypothetical protein
MHPPATPIYLRAVSILDRYSHGVCPQHPHLGGIAVGMSETGVADVAGMPRTAGLDCWLYPVTARAHGASRLLRPRPCHAPASHRPRLGPQHAWAVRSM